MDTKTLALHVNIWSRFVYSNYVSFFHLVIVWTIFQELRLLDDRWTNGQLSSVFLTYFSHFDLVNKSNAFFMPCAMLYQIFGNVWMIISQPCCIPTVCKSATYFQTANVYGCKACSNYNFLFKLLDCHFVQVFQHHDFMALFQVLQRK